MAAMQAFHRIVSRIDENRLSIEQAGIVGSIIMDAEFNILYPLIVLAAAACLFLAVQEVRGLPMLSLSLLAPPLLAAFITLALAHLAPLDSWLETVLGVPL